MPIIPPADGLDVGTSWDGPPSVAAVRAHLAALRLRDARPFGLVAVPITELRAVERALDGAYEAAWALADEGSIDFAGFGEEVMAALALVRRRLAERAP